MTKTDKRLLCACEHTRDDHQLRVKLDVPSNSLQVYAFSEKGGHFLNVQSVEVVKHEAGTLLDSLMTLSYSAAQTLMDDLYRAGIRPSEEGSAGEREALKLHLDDARRMNKELFQNMVEQNTTMFKLQTRILDLQRVPPRLIIK